MATILASLLCAAALSPVRAAVVSLPLKSAPGLSSPLAAPSAAGLSVDAELSPVSVAPIRTPRADAVPSPEAEFDSPLLPESAREFLREQVGRAEAAREAAESKESSPADLAQAAGRTFDQSGRSADSALQAVAVFQKRARADALHDGFSRPKRREPPGAAGPGAFDFTAAMRPLCEDIAARLPVFRHVRMDQVAVTFAQARRRVSYGLQAKLTPLRFEGGALVTKRHGRAWTIQRWYDGRREMLYMLTFYLPRFLDQSFREKMITIVHELYHINPEFNGDIRRLAGHFHVHSGSQKEYDRAMDRLVQEYLDESPPWRLLDFLRHDFRELSASYGGVVGTRVPIPKLLPLSSPASN